MTLLIEADASINVPSTEIARWTLPRLGLRQQRRQDLGRDVAHQHKHVPARSTASKRSADPRGGPNAEIHALVNALGNPVELVPSPGQAGDLARAEPLIENSGPTALIDDKVSDVEPLLEALAGTQINPVFAIVCSTEDRLENYLTAVEV